MVGFSIGCVGVGGVLLIPILRYIGGLDIHLAMSTTMWSIIFTGAVGTVVYSRYGAIDGRAARWLSFGAIPGAFLGSRISTVLPDGILEAAIGVLIIATALHALARQRVSERPAAALSGPVLLWTGAAVGFGSGLSGTGGALLLVPSLMTMRVPVLQAVAASQVIQLPIAVFASAAYIVYGHVPYLLGTGLAAIEVVGLWAGARTAYLLPASVLRRVVAIALLAAGALMLIRATGAAAVALAHFAAGPDQISGCLLTRPGREVATKQARARPSRL